MWMEYLAIILLYKWINPIASDYQLCTLIVWFRVHINKYFSWKPAYLCSSKTWKCSNRKFNFKNDFTPLCLIISCAHQLSDLKCWQMRCTFPQQKKSNSLRGAARITDDFSVVVCTVWIVNFVSYYDIGGFHLYLFPFDFSFNYIKN